jgi:hypothetical protein
MRTRVFIVYGFVLSIDDGENEIAHSGPPPPISRGAHVVSASTGTLIQ